MNYLTFNMTKSILIFILASFTICTMSGQDQLTLKQAVSDAEKSIQKLVTENKAVGLTAGVARDGQIIWQDHEGLELSLIHISEPTRPY